MKKLALILFTVLTFCSLEVRAQTTTVSDADKAAIKQTALDYIEGWYEGNAERMERALHPEPAKRNVRTNPQNGKGVIEQIGAMTLVQGTVTIDGQPLSPPVR